MASRPIRRRRFALLDQIGIEEVSEFYIEECSGVRDLCHKLFEVTKEGTRPGNQDFYAWIEARGHSEFWKTTVWAKQEIEKEKVFEGMHRMMQKLDDGEATVAEAKAYRKATDENLFAVGRRGRI